MFVFPLKNLQYYLESPRESKKEKKREKEKNSNYSLYVNVFAQIKELSFSQEKQ